MRDKTQPRVLIVEDEPLILVDLELALSDLGYRVVAKAQDLVDGLILAEKSDVDIAVLDVNLAGLSSSKIADVLLERGVPFLFVTGYTSRGIAPHLRKTLRVAKPFETATLGQALEDLLGTKAAHRDTQGPV